MNIMIKGDIMVNLNEFKVRELLMNELNEKYINCNDTRIISELGLDFGASRIDVAVVNGILHGYEIKSDLDNLNRLPRQMEYYNKIFERMTIVASRKYLDDLKEIVPSWWGIKIISSDQKRLIEVRKGRQIKCQDINLILKLLWKRELEELIDFLGWPKVLKKKRKNQLLSMVYKEADHEIIKNYVYTVLKTRENWRVN